MSRSLTRILGLIACLFLAGAGPVAAAEADAPRHGIAMHGDPVLPADFSHLPYANPDAPKGGRITLAIQGTFDSLNPLIVLGVAPPAVPDYVLQSLMMRSRDEPFTVYGLIARSAEMPDDRSSVTFNLDPRARFSDGHPLTSEDVRFTFELLKTYGKPFHRSSFGQVRSVTAETPHRITFDLSGSNDRELPLIIATMPIFPAHATDPDRFDRTTLAPPVGSGPYAITEVRPGERIVLKRRKDFWAADLPILRGLYNFDEIRYDFYRDDNTMFEAFRAGLYDFRLEGDPARWATGYTFSRLLSGRTVRETVPIRLPKGMNGLVFNTRRPIFGDPRVREALGYLFDFDWLNRNLYYGLLTRADSYFSGSELSSTGQPADERERSLLAAFPGAVRDDFLEGRWRPPSPDGSGRDRAMARRALSLLSEAGWAIRDDVLRNERTGEPFTFEMLVSSSQQERLALNFAQSLERIGISARVRLVDNVQYWRRLSQFDFDMVQWVWPASASPGNEQRNRWSSDAADRSGSLNFAGVASPAVDRMVDALLEAKTREEFVSSVRALDRVLLSGFYVIPLFYVGDQWVAYDGDLQKPDRTPLFGPSIDTWWRPPR
ncbi:extracellular solute-binding protein [Microvirga sp. M2]|uniref:extracellular solute-binding protein n=1 Tax=Microvirga sp. M2 TaxID=3073270 RepID=UPI0039C11131